MFGKTTKKESTLETITPLAAMLLSYLAVRSVSGAWVKTTDRKMQATEANTAAQADAVKETGGKAQFTQVDYHGTVVLPFGGRI